MKAVFLDRDGVINVEVDNLHDPKKLELIPRAAEAIALLNKYSIPAIVVTNQPVIARGWLTEKDVEALHDEIQRRLKKDHAFIDAFYYCPHHPNANVEQYRIVCECRKPNADLFKQAAKKFGINLAESYIVGDSFRDIEAGKTIGATTIAVASGASDFRESVADYNLENLYEAVQLILKKENYL